MAATMKAHPSLPLALTGWPRQSLALARDSRRFDVVRQRAAPRAAAAAPPPRLAGGELVVLVLTPFSFDALARFNRCHPAATLIGRNVLPLRWERSAQAHQTNPRGRRTFCSARERSQFT